MQKKPMVKFLEKVSKMSTTAIVNWLGILGISWLAGLILIVRGFPNAMPDFYTQLILTGVWIFPIISGFVMIKRQEIPMYPYKSIRGKPAVVGGFLLMITCVTIMVVSVISILNLPG